MGKRGSESTFVHFRPLFQEARTKALSLDIIGKDEHAARVQGEAGGEAHFRFSPCL